ncbi:MAG: hypothetical protein ACNA70_07545, partial [Brevefilum sp.]
MKKNLKLKLLTLLLAFGMFTGMVAPVTGLAQAPEPQEPVLVAPEVLQEIEQTGSASYWINFKSEADLSAAYDMDWSARGWYVYDRLSKTAAASQANVSGYLASSGVEFRPFWIKNTIFVEKSGLETLNGL